MIKLKALFSKLSFSTQVLLMVIPLVILIGFSVQIIAYTTISHILLQIIQTEKYVAQNSIWKQLSYVQYSQAQMLNAFENTIIKQMRIVNKFMLLNFNDNFILQDINSQPNQYINLITLNLTNLSSTVPRYYKNYDLIEVFMPLIFNDEKSLSVEMIFWLLDDGIYSHFRYDKNLQNYLNRSQQLWYQQWQYLILDVKSSQKLLEYSVFSQVLQNFNTSICKTIGLFNKEGNLIGAICSQIDQNKYQEALKQQSNFLGFQYITSQFGAYLSDNNSFDYFFNQNSTGYDLEDFEIIVSNDITKSNCWQAHNLNMVCRYNKKLKMDTIIQSITIQSSQAIIINIVTQEYYDDFVQNFYLELYSQLMDSLTRYLIIFVSMISFSIIILFVILRRLTQFSQSLKFDVFHKGLTTQIKTFKNIQINQYSSNQTLNKLILAYENMIKQNENSSYKQSNICRFLQNQQMYQLNSFDKTGYQYIIQPITQLQDFKSIFQGIEILILPEVKQSFQEQKQ
ncbi:hypothetical protein pb186bvf_011976 [Paramecium bursaria]